jgi:hypothetical protein
MESAMFVETTAGSGAEAFDHAPLYKNRQRKILLI